MARGAILGGALLLSISTAWAQTSTVRIRVTDVSGKAIPGATVSLLNNWNRKIGTSATDAVGEVRWPRPPFGQWHFMVIASGFEPDVFALNICENREQTIQSRLPVAPPDRNIEQITVQAEARLLKLDPMPYCDVLDLPQALKPK